MDSECLCALIRLATGGVTKAIVSGADDRSRTVTQYSLVLFVCPMCVAVFVFTGSDGPDDATVQETDDPTPISGVWQITIHLSALVHKMEVVLLVADSLSDSGDKVKIRERFVGF